MNDLTDGLDDVIKSYLDYVLLAVLSQDLPSGSNDLAVGLRRKLSTHGSHYHSAEETFGSRVVHLFYQRWLLLNIKPLVVEGKENIIVFLLSGVILLYLYLLYSFRVI